MPVGQEPDDKRLTSSSYSFVTECFFMAHRAFDIGYRVAVEKLGRLNQVCMHNINRILLLTIILIVSS